MGIQAGGSLAGKDSSDASSITSAISCMSGAGCEILLTRTQLVAFPGVFVGLHGWYALFRTASERHVGSVGDAERRAREMKLRVVRGRESRGALRVGFLHISVLGPTA